MSEDPQDSAAASSGRTITQRVGLILGLLVLIAIVAAPNFSTFTNHAAGRLKLEATAPAVCELARGMQTTLAIMVIMIVWWVTEAVPIPVTALLPGLLLPLLHVTGTDSAGRPFVFDSSAAFASFASPVIYLFLAGFLLAAAMRRTGLDRRLTLGILSWNPMMRGPGTILFVIMVITGFVSMWMSNTATTAMMLPITVTILDQLGQRPGKSSFGVVLMLAIAWASSIGGVGTILGTPPNGIVVGILRRQGVADITFLQWLKLGMPVVVLNLIVGWAILMALHRPRLGDTAAARRTVRQARDELGRLSRDELATLLTFGLVVVLWVSQPFWGRLFPGSIAERLSRVDEFEIGLLGALLLFIVPLDLRSWRTVLTWRDSRQVEWGTLILFGGGIALSEAVFRTGLAAWLGEAFVAWIGRPSPVVSLTLIVLLVVFLSEVTSNTALASMITPILLSLAPQLGLPPLILCVAGAFAASLAFMLPVGTPPNALVYASGYIRMSQMVRAGFLMNLAGCAVVVLSLYFISGRLFGALPLH
jgi:sodium-dependent dicarboxylate transporter 2/3/5